MESEFRASLLSAFCDGGLLCFSVESVLGSLKINRRLTFQQYEKEKLKDDWWTIRQWTQELEKKRESAFFFLRYRTANDLLTQSPLSSSSRFLVISFTAPPPTNSAAASSTSSSSPKSNTPSLPSSYYRDRMLWCTFSNALFTDFSLLYYFFHHSPFSINCFDECTKEEFLSLHQMKEETQNWTKEEKMAREGELTAVMYEAAHARKHAILHIPANDEPELKTNASIPPATLIATVSSPALASASASFPALTLQPLAIEAIKSIGAAATSGTPPLTAVLLSVDFRTESLTLDERGKLSLEELSKRFTTLNEPRYALFLFQHNDKSSTASSQSSSSSASSAALWQILFIFFCPLESKQKSRVQYGLLRSFVISAVEKCLFTNCKLRIRKSIDVNDAKELNFSLLLDELYSNPSFGAHSLLTSSAKSSSLSLSFSSNSSNNLNNNLGQTLIMKTARPPAPCIAKAFSLGESLTAAAASAGLAAGHGRQKTKMTGGGRRILKRKEALKRMIDRKTDAAFWKTTANAAVTQQSQTTLQIQLVAAGGK